jgi:hypothetical protein
MDPYATDAYITTVPFFNMIREWPRIGYMELLLEKSGFFFLDCSQNSTHGLLPGYLLNPPRKTVDG